MINQNKFELANIDIADNGIKYQNVALMMKLDDIVFNFTLILLVRVTYTRHTQDA